MRVLLLTVLAIALFPTSVGAQSSFVQERAKLVPSDPTGFAGFGYSVALSSDGRTALVGGPVDSTNYGAAWVFVREGGVWVQQGPKLRPPHEGGVASFGAAVALSGDGNTALIGAHNEGLGAGAAYVFVREGSTWHEAQKLEPSGRTSRAEFAWSVAVSRDGQTALIGAPQQGANEGSAWVYRRNGEVWEEQAQLNAGEPGAENRFGWSVALSADGSTTLAGGWGAGETDGRVWAFTREGSTWTQQGPSLAPSDPTGHPEFGWAVALSDDGNTGLISGLNDHFFGGSAWIFAREAGAWVQHGAKLQAAEPRQDEGFQVALAGSGTSGLLGGLASNRVAEAWSFISLGGEWVEEGPLAPLDEMGKGEFGIGVALSGAGQTALIGGPSDNNVGAAWLFERPQGTVPTVLKIAPKNGPPVGGTSITITGKNLSEATAVLFGSAYAPAISPLTATSVIATSPPGSSGPVDVRVITAGGISPTTTKDLFTYQRPTITSIAPNSGTVSGGTEVTITGSGFATGTATTFKFGGTVAATIACTSTTTCRVRTPTSSKPRTVEVIATVGKASSPKNPPSDQYTYS
jgi:hypothetical protein